jgi:hypothetical protein
MTRKYMEEATEDMKHAHFLEEAIAGAAPQGERRWIRFSLIKCSPLDFLIIIVSHFE